MLRAWEESKAGTYERIAAYPMFVLSMLFLLAFCDNAQQLGQRGRQEVRGDRHPLTWAAFLIDYLIGLTLSPNRKRFVRTHLTQLAAVVFPVLRFLMVVHAFSVMRKLPVRC